MKFLRKSIRKAFNLVGLDLILYRPKLPPVEEAPIGINVLSDIRRLLRVRPPIIFDIGANVGQTVQIYKGLLPESEIHSFEPSPSTFEQLVHKVGYHQKLHLNNVAVGSSSGTNKLFENDHSDMSSFLELGTAGWGEIIKETEVKTVTLDQYCDENNVPYISLLKSDTQGYEFEVLKGCNELIRNNQIEMILIEMNFSELYKDQPRFDELYRFLIDRGFRLVSFYGFRYQNDYAGWTNGLFRNINFDDNSITLEQT
jgi:FkbM family methyltransferase